MQLLFQDVHNENFILDSEWKLHPRFYENFYESVSFASLPWKFHFPTMYPHFWPNSSSGQTISGVLEKTKQQNLLPNSNSFLTRKRPHFLLLWLQEIDLHKTEKWKKRQRQQHIFVLSRTRHWRRLRLVSFPSLGRCHRGRCSQRWPTSICRTSGEVPRS